MVTISNAFSGFAVKDIEAAASFYGDVLGLDVEPGPMGLLTLHLPGGTHVIAYPKEDHEPAGFTILNFEVTDIDDAVRALAEGGVTFLRYDGFDQDEVGVCRGTEKGQGPDIAWFTDPSGNVLAILSE